MILWNDIEIRGKPASFYDNGTTRLYVCERFSVIEAWVGSEKIGNFESIPIAKAAAERKVSVHPKAQAADVEDEIDDDIEADELDEVSPEVEAITSPEVALKPNGTVVDGLGQCDWFRQPQPHSAMQVHAPIEVSVEPSEKRSEPLQGHCKCGVRLGRSGKCPALCEPVPDVAPVYDGPRMVGLTHIGRMAAPVR